MQRENTVKFLTKTNPKKIFEINNIYTIVQKDILFERLPHEITP